MVKSKYIQLLEEVVKSLPREREYLNAHSLLRKTLTELACADVKRKKRLRNEQAALTPNEQWRLDLETSTLYNPTEKVISAGVIKSLDEMIAKEKQKLEQIRNRNIIEKIEVKDKSSNEDMGTIFG